MRGSSRTSLGQAVDRLEAVLGQTDGVSLGEELFSVTDLLKSSGTLRRALTDPSRSGDMKASVVQQVLTGRLSGVASEALQGLVRDRWTAPDDLLTAVDHLGATSVLAAAERYGVLDAVSEELFRFERLVDAHCGLQQALADPKASVEHRLGLVQQLLGDKTCRESTVLIRRAVQNAQQQSVAKSLDSFAGMAAERQQRGIARVESALPLNDNQIDRMRVALTRIYGREMQVNVDVVPEVMGGIRVHVGDEVIDATILSRLNDAHRRFAE